MSMARSHKRPVRTHARSVGRLVKKKRRRRATRNVVARTRGGKGKRRRS
jgi:hypothetical protein